MSYSLILSGLISLMLAEPAYAYIDPNMGGLLFQILAPILLAIAAAWSLLKNKLTAFIRWLRRLWFGDKPDKTDKTSRPSEDR
jgi:hypothetical protein